MKASKFTAIDFLNDLGSTHARRRFLFGFFLVGLICVLGFTFTRAYVGDNSYRDLLEAILVEVFSGSVLIVFFYLMYMYFIGPNDAARDVRVTRPQDISVIMKGLPKQTRFYMFWGRSGSYFRAQPLLELAAEAKEKGLQTDIEIVLPDPTDENLMNAYSGILSSLDEDWKGNKLLQNVMATLLACAIVSANNRFLNVKLYFSKFIPAFRIDRSENGAILTQDNPNKSAIFFSADSEFFDMMRNMIRSEIALSSEVRWDPSTFEGLALEEASATRTILEAFGVALPDDDNLQHEIGILVAKRPHRYRA